MVLKICPTWQLSHVWSLTEFDFWQLSDRSYFIYFKFVFSTKFNLISERSLTLTAVKRLLFDTIRLLTAVKRFYFVSWCFLIKYNLIPKNVVLHWQLSIFIFVQYFLKYSKAIEKPKMKTQPEVFRPGNVTVRFLCVNEPKKSQKKYFSSVKKNINSS